MKRILLLSVLWLFTCATLYAQCLSGSYSIGGTGANYADVATAAQALNTNGVCGPVVFTVNPGTYAGKVVLTAVTGASSVNTIRFIGSGAASCILIDSAANDAMVSVTRTGYVSFSNFTITNKAAATCAGVSIVGNLAATPVTNIRISNCSINLPNAGANNSFGILASHAVTTTSTFSYVDSLTIDSNTINGGTHGIQIYAGFNATSASHKGHKIRFNTIKNSLYYGMYFYAICNPFDVISNDVRITSSFANSAAIASTNCKNRSASGSVNFLNNTLSVNGAYGFFSFSDSSTTGGPHKYYNNIVSGTLTYTNNYGIYIVTTAGGSYDLLHNTISITGYGTSVYGLYYSNSITMSGLRAKNNIFSIMPQMGGLSYPLFTSQKQTGNPIDYNQYANSGSPVLISRGGVIGTSLAIYNTDSTGGDSSINITPLFDSKMSVTDGCHRGLNLTNIVPKDIRDSLRSSTPSMGAYEFQLKPNDLTIELVYQPSRPLTFGFQDVILRVKNVGTSPINTFSIGHTNNGGPVSSQTFYPNVNPCDTYLVVLSGSAQMNIVNGLNDISLFVQSSNFTADDNRMNDTLRLQFTYQQPLNGPYTIGGIAGPDNFSSFVAAANALKVAGISGPVTFTVYPGTYAGQVELTGILGISATNTVSFEGMDSATCVVTSASAGNATIKTSQLSYLSFRNLTIENTAAGNCIGIADIGTLMNTTGSNLSVSKCKIRLPNAGTSANSYGVLITGDYNGSAEAASNIDSVRIDSNTFIGGAFAVAFLGNATTAFNKGLVIRSNTISTYTAGMRCSGIYNPVDILSNAITTTNSSGYGVWMENNRVSGSISTRISGNKINTGYRGIYYNTYLNTALSPLKIYNNMINCSASLPGNTYGVYLSTATAGVGNVEFYHNTVYMTGAAATYALYYSGSATNSMFYNNILATLGTAYPAYFSTNVTTNTIDNNIYYNSSAGNLVYRGAAYNGMTYKSSSAGGDASLNIKPTFFSATDLRIKNTCYKGTNLLASVPTDMFGNTRTSTPIIGAHEAVGVANDIAVEAVSVPKPFTSDFRDISVRVKNTSTTIANHFILSYKLNNGSVKSMPYTNQLFSCDTVSVLFTGLDQIKLAEGPNTLIVYTSLPNGLADENTENDTLILNLTGVSAKPGAALAAGTGKYIRMQNTKLDSVTSFSAEAWFKLATSTSTTARRIIAKSNNTNGFDIGVQSGVITAGVWTSTGTTGGAKTMVTGGNIPANRWTHVALTWQSGVGVKLYINGALVTTTATAATNMIGSLTDMTIGANSWDFGNALNGNVDEVRLWNTALDSVAIRRGMHKMLTGTEAGLISYVQLNEGVSTTWVGDAVNGSIGVLSGTAPFIAVSTIPAGGDSSLFTGGVMAGNYQNKNISVSFTDNFDAPCDLTITEVPNAPNALPVATNVVNNKYWIVRSFDQPGTFLADLTFTFPAAQLNTSDAALGLYRREYNGDSAYWKLVKLANTITGTTVTFSGIDTFGQFTVASNGTSPLPVKLLAFNGRKEQKDVLLTWTTASEINNNGFEIQRSVDGQQFEKIGFVKSNTTSGELNNYRFTDIDAAINNQNNPIYYRLKQLDNDQTAEYSKTIVITSGHENQSVNVYPNPFNNELHVSINHPTQSVATIELFDIRGKKVLHETAIVKQGESNVAINNINTLNEGVYVVIVTINNQREIIKLIKQ